MIVVKNTYGVSTAISPRIASIEKIDSLGGSSLDRKKYPRKPKDEIAELLKKPLFAESDDQKKDEIKLRTMSRRSKSKIRKKLISFARIHQKLSFLTLTFCNSVKDSQAVKVLAVFLKNVTKQSQDFQYLWVAEKQGENAVFTDNIHFHLITNKYWKIGKWWKYWLDLQAKQGILPRDENFRPTSAFDVKQVKSNNIKGVVNYLTKYVTKNLGKFGCQVWNCSKKISQLYTEFYSDMAFIREFERLEQAGLLGGEMKIFPQQYCNVHLIPLNRTTMPFYNRIDEANKKVWKATEGGDND